MDSIESNLTPAELGKPDRKARAAEVAGVIVLAPGAETNPVWRGLVAVCRRMALLSAASVFVVSAFPQAGHASTTPRAGVKDARVRSINYDPDQVVTIVGGFRHAIEIQFAPNETVTQAALGDTVSWEIAPIGNALFLKPREKAGPTNLIVVTSVMGATRTYHFQLVMGKDALMYGVRFRYPNEEAAAAVLASRALEMDRVSSAENNVVNLALDHAVIEGKRNFAYSIQGASELAPSEVSDNGEFTVLRYPGHTDIPSIFGVGPDGAETIVPYDVREDFVVIHAVYRQLRLRRGNVVLCVYNDAPPTNDRDARTGTVSNIVERRVKGQ